jgi:hypothetical protein
VYPLYSFTTFYWNQKAHYHVHKSSSIVLIPSKINPVHTTLYYLYEIYLNVTHPLRLGLPSGLFPSGLLTNNLNTFLFSPIPATYRAHLILLSVIEFTLREEKKSRCSSLCSFLHPPISSSHFGQNILLSTLFSNTLSICKLWGFHGGDYEECRLIGCYALWLL